jgi:hypothetical protein
MADVRLYRRILYALLALALLASLHVAERRERQERAAATVEIVMDDADFATFARAFGLDQERFLKRLKSAGLTSLGISEELGAGLPGSGHATAFTGGALRDQSVLAPLRDPLLAGLARSGALHDDAMYVLAYDGGTARRFAFQLPLKFPAGTVRQLRASLPALWEVRTQSDYFAAAALGLPDDRIALAHAAGLWIDPRLQNDQTFDAQHVSALVDSASGPDETTAIFFGLRNEVLGYPDELAATAKALRAHRLTFGTIEVYDQRTLQAGNDQLARRLAAYTVRVQAIGKIEQDKLRAEDIVARFLLGVRERNVRVVYLRPFTHPWKGRSVEDANVAIVAAIADGIRASGLRIGRPAGFTRMTFSPWEIAIVSLAAPAIVLLILLAPGIGGWPWLGALVLADLIVVAAAFATHHDIVARQAVAFVAGVGFPTAALLAIGWSFRGEVPFDGRFPALANPYLRGLCALVVATLVTLGGALVVVGVLSTATTMTEIDRFLGVKELLVLPALFGLGLYFFSPHFGAKVDPRAAADAPVRWAPLLVGLVLLAGAFVVLQRSGNTTDVTPSGLELSLRSQLTALLQVRPRFKDMIGFPALMLLPALLPADRRRWGWLFILAIGLGCADLIDTFSHLHTALAISAFRIFNGAVLGAIGGAVLIALYRVVRR